MIGKDLLRKFNEDFLSYNYHQIREEFSKVFISQCGNLKFQDVKRRIEKSTLLISLMQVQNLTALM